MPKLILFRSVACVLLLVATQVATFTLSAPSEAASLQARLTNSPPATGERFVIEVQLQLDLAESASVFEAEFELRGAGESVAVATDAPSNTADSSWTSAQSHWQESVLRVSLTSNNTGGARGVVRIELVALEPGPVELLLTGPPILQADQNAYPYLVDIPLSFPPPSEPLVSARVRNPVEIPMPPMTLLLLSLGLLGANFVLQLWPSSRRET